MVFRLRDRNRPLPNGIGCFDPSTNYRAPAFSTFTQQVNGVMAARIGNPGMCARYRLKTDYSSCEEYVDTFLGKVAFDNGWSDFYISERGDGTPNVPADPKLPTPRAGSVSPVKAVAVGAKTIYEWISSKAGAVPQKLANKRAAICAKCPLNETAQTILEAFETKAAEAIMAEMKRRQEWDLHTPDDNKLGICGGCYCVNKLSVHCPIDIKLKHLPQEAFDALDENCWVRYEKSALTK